MSCNSISPASIPSGLLFIRMVLVLCDLIINLWFLKYKDSWVLIDNVCFVYSNCLQK